MLPDLIQGMTSACSTSAATQSLANAGKRCLATLVLLGHRKRPNQSCLGIMLLKPLKDFGGHLEQMNTVVQLGHKGKPISNNSNTNHHSYSNCRKNSRISQGLELLNLPGSPQSLIRCDVSSNGCSAEAALKPFHLRKQPPFTPTLPLTCQTRTHFHSTTDMFQQAQDKDSWRPTSTQ